MKILAMNFQKYLATLHIVIDFDCFFKYATIE